MYRTTLEEVEPTPTKGRLYIKSTIPYLDLLPWIPYAPWMWILPGCEVVKKPVSVKQIRYEVEGRAATHTDGMRYDIALYRDGVSVFSKTKMFAGRSCTKCSDGKPPNPPLLKRVHTFDPPIEADQIMVIAHDIETDSQYIQVNRQRFRIPTAGDNKIIGYEFDLSD